jgi:uncharacterized membrane-anchored protein YhcB (DUF1043 family)
MGELTAVEVMLAILTILGVGKLLELMVIRFLNRKIDSVATQKVTAETTKTEVETVRQVLEEVKAHSATKDLRIDKLENDLSRVEIRMEKLEERERHALTRAAVHEAWDQMSFQLLIQHHPDHPAPPPLIGLPIGDSPHEVTLQHAAEELNP